ncbi:hypothetical protein ACJ72_07107, partial [Emergomyces africanus]
PPEAPTFTAQQLFLKAKRTIIEATESEGLGFEDVGPHSETLISSSPSETPEVERLLPRSVLIHTSPASKPGADISTVFILDFLGFTGFLPPYASSSKEPDLAIRPDTAALPNGDY